MTTKKEAPTAPKTKTMPELEQDARDARAAFDQAARALENAQRAITAWGNSKRESQAKAQQAADDVQHAAASGVSVGEYRAKHGR